MGTTYLPVYDNGQVASYAGTAMDATDYRGRYSVDVLNDCAEASGRNYFAYWDSAAAAGEEISLYYHLLGFTTGFTSSIRLTNHAADIDGSVTFAATAELNRDPSRVYSGVWMPYDGGHIWKTRSSTAAAFISRHAVAPALTTKNRTKASNRADNFLDHADAEYDIIKATAELPKAYVNAAPIGRSIDVKFDHLPGYESGYTSIQIHRRQVAQLPLEPRLLHRVLRTGQPEDPRRRRRYGPGRRPEAVRAPIRAGPVPGPTRRPTFCRVRRSRAALDRPPAPNPTYAKLDANHSTKSTISSGVARAGVDTGDRVVDLGSATAVGGWGLSFDACCNSCPLYLEASTDDFASSVVAIDTTDVLQGHRRRPRDAVRRPDLPLLAGQVGQYATRAVVLQVRRRRRHLGALPGRRRTATNRRSASRSRPEQAGIGRQSTPTLLHERTTPTCRARSGSPSTASPSIVTELGPDGRDVQDRLTISDRRRVARHEAAHAALAHRFGWRLDSVWIAPTPTGLWHGQHDAYNPPAEAPPSSDREGLDRAARAIAVCLAGGIAAPGTAHSPPDDARAREIALWTVGEPFAERFLADCRDYARRLVADEAAAIDRLTAALLARRRLTGAEAVAILNGS